MYLFIKEWPGLCGPVSCVLAYFVRTNGILAIISLAARKSILVHIRVKQHQAVCSSKHSLVTSTLLAKCRSGNREHPPNTWFFRALWVHNPHPKWDHPPSTWFFRTPWVHNPRPKRDHLPNTWFFRAPWVHNPRPKRDHPPNTCFFRAPWVHNQNG